MQPIGPNSNSIHAINSSTENLNSQTDQNQNTTSSSANTPTFRSLPATRREIIQKLTQHDISSQQRRLEHDYSQSSRAKDQHSPRSQGRKSSIEMHLRNPSIPIFISKSLRKEVKKKYEDVLSRTPKSEQDRMISRLATDLFNQRKNAKHTYTSTTPAPEKPAHSDSFIDFANKADSGRKLRIHAARVSHKLAKPKIETRSLPASQELKEEKSTQDKQTLTPNIKKESSSVSNKKDLTNPSRTNKNLTSTSSNESVAKHQEQFLEKESKPERTNQGKEVFVYTGDDDVVVKRDANSEKKPDYLNRVEKPGYTLGEISFETKDTKAASHSSLKRSNTQQSKLARKLRMKKMREMMAQLRAKKEAIIKQRAENNNSNEESKTQEPTKKENSSSITDNKNRDQIDPALLQNQNDDQIESQWKEIRTNIQCILYKRSRSWEQRRASFCSKQEKRKKQLQDQRTKFAEKAAKLEKEFSPRHSHSSSDSDSES